MPGSTCTSCKVAPLAPADCTEVRVTLTDAERMAYALSEPEESYRVGSTAVSKLPVVEALIAEAPAGKFIELSPGRTLAGLAKRINRRLPVESVEG